MIQQTAHRTIRFSSDSITEATRQADGRPRHLHVDGSAASEQVVLVAARWALASAAPLSVFRWRNRRGRASTSGPPAVRTARSAPISFVLPPCLVPAARQGSSQERPLVPPDMDL